MMKNVILFCSLILMTTSFSCGGGGSAPTPDPANDNSYKGVYKGVLTGSTGHFWIDAYNTDATKVTLTFTFDGDSKTIEGVKTMSGSDYVYTFTDPEYLMIFEVTPTGSVVTATFTHIGHTGSVVVTADKATSTHDVDVYEGTWVSSDGQYTGVWNMVVKEYIGQVVASEITGTGVTVDLSGTVSIAGDVSVHTSGNDITATGTTSEGTWIYVGYSTGTYTGGKTL